MSGQMPSWLAALAPKQEKGYSIIEQLSRPMTAVDRLRNGGQPDLADQVDTEIREAYAAGIRQHREHLESLGAVADCNSCGGRGERLMGFMNGPDAYQDLVDCPDCKGTGYAIVRPA